MKRKVLKEKCYLYLFRNGKMFNYEGDVCEYIYGNAYTFISKGGQNKVSTKPNTVYNGSVWMEQPDEKLANTLLIDHEFEEIVLLEEKITTHMNKINFLKGVI